MYYFAGRRCILQVLGMTGKWKASQPKLLGARHLNTESRNMIMQRAAGPRKDNESSVPDLDYLETGYEREVEELIWDG